MTCQLCSPKHVVFCSLNVVGIVASLGHPSHPVQHLRQSEGLRPEPLVLEWLKWLPTTTLKLLIILTQELSKMTKVGLYSFISVSFYHFFFSLFLFLSCSFFLPFLQTFNSVINYSHAIPFILYIITVLPYISAIQAC